MIFGLIILLCCFCGLILFTDTCLGADEPLPEEICVSVIIPARNEEMNIPLLLDSLMAQTYRPQEIIVVDDHSTDRTGEIARRYDVTVLDNPELPENWTGKNWALWNGYQESSGNVLIFLDADVILENDGLETLLKTRQRANGAISVVPYHSTKKFYEKLSLLTYLLGVFAFTSPFEKRNPKKGLYGSCIVTARDDYDRISGHRSVRSEVLDDLNLGRRFADAGIRVENFIGRGHVSFRMYPYGIMNEIYGFGKGAVLSTAVLTPLTICFIALWVVGLFAAGFGTPVLLLLGSPLGLPFLATYLVYTVQILYFLKYTGSYGVLMPLLHFVSSLFFLMIMTYSAYRVVFVGTVSWKGREISVRGGRT